MAYDSLEKLFMIIFMNLDNLIRAFSRAKVWNIGYLYEEFNIFGILN